MRIPIADTYGDCDGHIHADGFAFTDDYPKPNSYGDAYGYSYSNRNCNSYRDGNGHSPSANAHNHT